MGFTQSETEQEDLIIRDPYCPSTPGYHPATISNDTPFHGDGVQSAGSRAGDSIELKNVPASASAGREDAHPRRANARRKRRRQHGLQESFPLTEPIVACTAMNRIARGHELREGRR
jgi:hypothetical protein